MSDGTCDAHAPPAQVLGTVTADCSEVATVLFGVLRSYCIIKFNIRIHVLKFRIYRQVLVLIAQTTIC